MRMMGYFKHLLLPTLAVLTVIASACAIPDEGTIGSMTEEESCQIAENYVSNSPTFTFDGIQDTLQLVEILYPDSEDALQFVFQFESRHPGYGNRSGQILAQVVTPHQAVITIEHGEIKSALIDEKWDMIEQQILKEEETMPGTPTSPTPYGSDMEVLVIQAKEDLTERLSIPVDQIEVLEATSVVWPDASLGCPQPDMRYKQVQVDGALIRLQANGQVYEYHSGGSRGLFLCQ
jgi:hypothetical protein